MRYAPLLLLLFAGACAFSSPPERTRYALQADAVLPPAVSGAHAGILRVSATTAPYDLDSTAIEIQTAEGRISNVQNAAWVRRLPAMLQPLILRALEHSGRYANVVDDASPVLATRQLHVSVERFTLVYPEAHALPHVEVALRAELINPNSGALVFVRRLTASEPVEEVRMHKIIPAFERALASCLQDLSKAMK